MNKQDLKTVSDNFLKELQDAQNGKKTSLAFIKNTLPTDPLVANNETFQVMSLGGTIFRSALITKTSDGLKISNVAQRSHPVFSTKEIFLEFVTENLHPRITMLAINFAQALEPVFENGKLDGKLVGNAKEHAFTGLMGEKVADELEKYIAKETSRNIKISIANDSICLMLSGLTKYSSENLAAGIVGTGFNFAIFLDSTHPINLEAGAFNKFSISTELKEIDNASEKPGLHLWEKEVAGAYLHEHFNSQIKNRKIRYPLIKSAKELDSVIRQEIPGVSEIALDVMHTSAREVGALIAGIMNFHKRDVNFVMQGSLFWKGYEYKETVEDEIRSLCPFKANFVFIEDADFLGAAKLIA